MKLPGGAPDQLDLLLRFSDSDSTVVVPVTPGASSAQYVWDASSNAITPNTRIAYRWRATNAGVVTLQPGAARSSTTTTGPGSTGTAPGSVTPRCTGTAASEAQARHFGQITANAAAAAEKLLGHSLAGPIDIFVYVVARRLLRGAGSGRAGVDRSGDLPGPAHRLHVARRRIAQLPRYDRDARGDARRLPRRDRQPVPRPADLVQRGLRRLVGASSRPVRMRAPCGPPPGAATCSPSTGSASRSRSTRRRPALPTRRARRWCR